MKKIILFGGEGHRKSCIDVIEEEKKFVDALISRIPMGRMVNIEEYKASIIYLCSDASSYMIGQNIVIDGGRTVW